MHNTAARVVFGMLAPMLTLGCSHRAAVPGLSLIPLAESPKRLETGTVVLRLAGVGHDRYFQQPGAIGGGQGAKAGASLGAIIPVMLGGAVLKGGPAHPSTLVFGLAALGAGIALAPVGAAAGAAVGALAAPSKEEVEQSTAALERALADLQVPYTLFAQILEAGRAYPIIPPPIAVDPDTAPWVSVLELAGPRVSLSSDDPTDWKPKLRLRLIVDAKLVRATDREELDHWSWKHEGREARLVDWGKDDARLFREELERAIRAIAFQAVNDLFE